MRYLALGIPIFARGAAAALAISASFLAPALAWAQSADLSVVKTAPATVDAGTNLTYSITVTNAGPDDAQVVDLNDPLPAGSTFVTGSQTAGPAFACTTPAVGAGGTVDCTIATLIAGDSATFSLTVFVPAGATPGGIGSNTATLSSVTADPDASNNSSTATTTITASADLSVTKTAPATVDAGTNLTYTITVANPGPSDAQTVSLSDPLPPGSTFVTGSQTVGPVFTCTTPAVGAGGTVDCSIATLAMGDSATFSLTILVPAGATPGGIGSNTATVSSATADPAPGTIRLPP